MSRWPTTEHYYAAQDDFRRYIQREVNPARAKAGLSEIRDDEARECFRIIDQFLDRWMGAANPTTPVQP